MAMAPPLVLRAPNTRSPLPAADEWDELMGELAQTHDVLVPASEDLADLDARLPDWGILGLLVPGAAVQLCPFTALRDDDGGPADGHDVLRRILVADVGETSLLRSTTGSGSTVTLGSATQLAPGGAVLVSDAMAWERQEETVVVLSTTALPALSEVMPRILLGLAELSEAPPTQDPTESE